MEIVQAVKKLNSISRERLNFRRRPILCTTLYRNLMQASNFGGTFDQLFLRIFYKIFTEDASLPLLCHGAKKSKMTKNSNQGEGPALRGAWSDRDTNDIFAHCSLIFYFLDFKFSNFFCPSELHPLIWFFLKNSFRKKKNIRKTTKNAFAPSIFIVLSIVLKLGTPLLHIQAQNTVVTKFLISL